MNRRRFFVILAVAALVTGGALVVHAYRGETPRLAQSAAEPGATAPAPAVSEAKSPEMASADSIPAEYDMSKLPDPVKRMIEGIVQAAQSGDVEEMRPVFESNELKPMLSAGAVDDPIAYWKRVSADGEGREILAVMLNVLSSGYTRVGEGREEMIVWPYFAEADLKGLTPAQEVDLYRLVPSSAATAMRKSGRYDFFRIGISPDGVWHYFLQ